MDCQGITLQCAPSTTCFLLWPIIGTLSTSWFAPESLAQGVSLNYLYKSTLNDALEKDYTDLLSMKMNDRRRIYTGTACINPSPPAVAHFAATRLPAYDCPEGYPAPQVKIEIGAGLFYKHLCN